MFGCTLYGVAMNKHEAGRGGRGDWTRRSNFLASSAPTLRRKDKTWHGHDGCVRGGSAAGSNHHKKHEMHHNPAELPDNGSGNTPHVGSPPPL